MTRICQNIYIKNYLECCHMFFKKLFDYHNRLIFFLSTVVLCLNDLVRIWHNYLNYLFLIKSRSIINLLILQSMRSNNLHYRSQDHLKGKSYSWNWKTGSLLMRLFIRTIITIIVISNIFFLATHNSITHICISISVRIILFSSHNKHISRTKFIHPFYIHALQPFLYLHTC